jgi:hypothetical protein
MESTRTCTSSGDSSSISKGRLTASSAPSSAVTSDTSASLTFRLLL